MHLAIVIPAYNEATVIGQVLDGLPKQLKKITKITPIVVDDFSKDNTYDVAKAHGAKTIRHPMNLGAGGATITGFELAKRLKADLIVTMDADGQHDPNDIEKIIRPIIQRHYDVVIGSRLKRQLAGMPRYKIVGNFLLNLVTFLFFAIWVTDSQSGFKAFSKRAIDTMRISSCGYEFCSEIIGEIKRHHLRYIEIPITVIYTKYSRKKGQHALNAINIFFGLLSRSFRHDIFR